MTTKTKAEAEAAATSNPVPANLATRIGDVQGTAARITGALTEGAKAYVGGIVEIGKTLGGFGREVAKETGDHLRATVQAKSLNEVGELQAAFLQNGIEMSATYAKELADLARVKSEEVIFPVTALFKAPKAA